MQEGKLTLYEIEQDDGSYKYEVSETSVLRGNPLASYNDISELYPNFYDTSNTYDVTLFTSNSSVGAFYATYSPTRTLSAEAKALIGAANSIHQMGEGNSQYGTRWIYSDELKESKKIRVTDKIPEGWKLGRKIKFDNEE